jgi:MFS family permease
MDSEPHSIFSRELLPVTSAVVATIAVNAFVALGVVAGLPSITAELGNVSLLAWVITAFLLMATLATMVAGQVIDALGVRTTFRLTMIFSFVGSTACAAAPTMQALVVFRGIQGVGAGFAFAVATATVGLAYPKHLRARALAAVSVTWGVMALGGPGIAALFVATTGWRGIFLAVLPVVGVATALGWSRLPGRDAPTRVSFDPVGVLLLGSFTVVSLLGFSSISTPAAVAAVLAVGLAVTYWIRAGKTAQPVLGRRYLAYHPIGAINIASGLAFGAALGLDGYLPVYVRGGLGYSAVVAAFSVAFLTLGWTISSVVLTKVLDRYTETATALVGFGLLIPPFLIGLLFYDAGTPITLVLSMTFLLGLGVGTVSMSLLSLLYHVSQPAEIGRASSAHQYLRGLFQTYATALIGAIILLAVSSRLGSIEGIQQLLAEGGGTDNTEASQAIAAGFRVGNAAGLAFTVIGFVVAIRLQRQLRQPRRRRATRVER